MSPMTVVGTLNGAHSVHAHGTGEWRVEPGPEEMCPPGDTGNYAPDMAREQEESTDQRGLSAGSKEPLSGQAEVTLGSSLSWSSSRMLSHLSPQFRGAPPTEVT